MIWTVMKVNQPGSEVRLRGASPPLLLHSHWVLWTPTPHQHKLEWVQGPMGGVPIKPICQIQQHSFLLLGQLLKKKNKKPQTKQFP